MKKITYEKAKNNHKNCLLLLLLLCFFVFYFTIIQMYVTSTPLPSLPFKLAFVLIPRLSIERVETMDKNSFEREISMDEKKIKKENK